MFLSSPEEIVDEARNGRMFILVDDEDRENEGDLVIPAQMATPDAINFMARHGRGLICLALGRARAETLGLDLLNSEDESRHQTAFTASIEARHGVTTGISAADRARTIAVAIDSARGRDEIVTPGHVFPLIARDGGVLVRAGHTEAAVDVSRLAGLNPSGVICEIMNEDGTMARLDDLIDFARVHGLLIGTIRDLIKHRLKHDHLVERRAEMLFESRWGGTWRAVTYVNKVSGEEQMALVKGTISPDRPTLVRMHTGSFFVDMFGERSARSGLLSRSMEIIGEAGSGVVVVIARPMKDSLSRSIRLRRQGMRAGTPEIEALRDYGIGAQILGDLDVRDMVLLTNTHHALVALAGYGLSVSSDRAIDLEPAP